MSLATMLKAVVPDQGIIAASNTPAQCRELVTAARDHLKASMQARDDAAVVVTTCTAALERVMQLITAADDAALDLQDAEANSADFTRRWAEGGALVGVPSTDPKLKAKADRAASAAAAAKIAAAGAEAGLPAARAALHDAENALHRAVENIGRASHAVMAATIESEFSLAQQAAAAFDECAYVIQSFVRATGGHQYPFSDDSAAMGMLSRLRAMLPAMPARDVRELKRSNATLEESKKFVELGHRLLKDADAE